MKIYSIFNSLFTLKSVDRFFQFSLIFFVTVIFLFTPLFLSAQNTSPQQNIVKWYVFDEASGRTIGPYSKEEFYKKKFNKNVLVAKAGSNQWIPASKDSLLSDKSSLTKPEVKTQPEKQIEVKPKETAKPAYQEKPQITVQGNMWYVLDNGRTLGPYTKEKFYANGYNSRTKVCRMGTSNWIYASSDPDLVNTAAHKKSAKSNLKQNALLAFFSGASILLSLGIALGSFLFITLINSLFLFFLAPKVEIYISWKQAFIGAIIWSLGWTVLSFIFSWLVFGFLILKINIWFALFLVYIIPYILSCIPVAMYFKTTIYQLFILGILNMIAQLGCGCLTVLIILFLLMLGGSFRFH